MYDPQKSLYTGLQNHSSDCDELLPWDEYFPNMAEADYLAGRAEKIAVKSFFIREGPFGKDGSKGSYALMGGITDFLRRVINFSYENEDFLHGMSEIGYSYEFLDFIEKRGYPKVEVFAPKEGTVFFPHEPIISVRGPLVDIRLIEGILSSAVNFPSLSLTKWHRLIRAVRPGQVMDFSRRRSQDTFRASLYAMLAGCSLTSNSELRRFFDFKIGGTMGHEWVQSFGDVREAFESWINCKPGKPIGLVDTKDCLRHDFPIWLDVVYKNQDHIKKANSAVWGWRNDSGNLATLIIEQHKLFAKHVLSQDSWFRDRLRVILTNDLDEYRATEIIRQITAYGGSMGLNVADILSKITWAAGTRPGTCEDQPSLGGVMKLVEFDGMPCIKLAFDELGRPGIKTSVPGFNRSALIFDRNTFEAKFLYIYPDSEFMVCEDGLFYTKTKHYDQVETFHAYHPFEHKVRVDASNYFAVPQQELVYNSLSRKGLEKDWENQDVLLIPGRIQANVDRLPWQMSRLEKPTPMGVFLSQNLYDHRRGMIQRGALRSDKGWS